MTWFDWLLITWWVIGAILTVSVVGKPRGPLQPNIAAIVVLVNIALIAGLLITRGAL